MRKTAVWLCLQLWHSFFTLSVTFATQPDLQMENFSEVKREKLLRSYQDMRLLMGLELLSMWRLLGELVRCWLDLSRCNLSLLFGSSMISELALCRELRSCI